MAYAETAVGAMANQPDDVAIGIDDGLQPGVEESLVRGEVQLAITGKNLLMELCIDIHGVAFHQFACSKEVAFALDALHFSQQLSEELSEGFIFVDEQAIFMPDSFGASFITSDRI